MRYVSDKARRLLAGQSVADGVAADVARAMGV
jgi:hypothetical protein